MWLEAHVKPAFQPHGYAAETFRNIPNVLEDSGSEGMATCQATENTYAYFRQNVTSYVTIADVF